MRYQGDQLLTLENKFWLKVNKTDDCWIWIASRDRKGYGQISHRYNIYRAHRLSWEIHFGDIPEGLMVLHKCHNRACVNPEHLKLGTAQDNTDDMMKAGRHVSGFARLSS